MLKYLLEKEGYDALEDTHKAFYEEKDGKYTLKVEGIPEPDTSEQQAEIDRLKAKHAEAEKHRKAQEKAARDAAELAAKKSGDVDALEKSWGEKFSAAVLEKDAELEKLNNVVYNMTVKSTATKLAAELAVPGSADVLMPHIESRLTVETKDGKTQVRVKDAEGKPSAATIDDLKNELTNSPAFAPIISGSKASGSGYSGGNGGKAKKFNEYTGAALAKIYQENPQEYERLKNDYYGQKTA